jgi:hypothetical protein
MPAMIADLAASIIWQVTLALIVLMFIGRFLFGDD